MTPLQALIYAAVGLAVVAAINIAIRLPRWLLNLRAVGPLLDELGDPGRPQPGEPPAPAPSCQRCSLPAEQAYCLPCTCETDCDAYQCLAWVQPPAPQGDHR